MSESPLRAADVRGPGTDRADPGRALIGRPDPAIGAIVCALGNLDPSGRPADPTAARAGGPGEVAAGAVLGAIVGALVGIGLGASGVLGRVGGGVVLIAAATGALVFATWRWLRRRGGAEGGACVYVGDLGVERIGLVRGRLVRERQAYREAATVVRTATRAIGLDPGALHDAITFTDATGQRTFAISARSRASVPTLQPWNALVAEVAAQASRARAADARDAIARGGRMFPRVGLATPGGRFRPALGGLRWIDDRIELLESGGATPSRVLPVAGLADATIDQGFLVLTPRDGSQAGLTFEVSQLGDADLLLVLLRSPR